MPAAAGPADGLATNRPALDPGSVAVFLAARYDLTGRLTAVRSERDQTFHLRPDSGGPGFVVKISHRDEREGIVDFQIAALDHIARADPALHVPRMVPNRYGDLRDTIAGPDGQLHIFRLLTFVPGAILEDVHATCPDLPAMRRAVGAYVARLGLALRSFFHPEAGNNRHVWDLGGVTRLADQVRQVRDADLRGLCAQVLDRAASHTYPALVHCRHQIVHQDAHQGNLLVDPADSTRVIGVIDFGDMLHGSLLADLVTAADCFLDAEADPVAVLADVTAGYDSVNPLEEGEIALVYDMCRLRLANTVLIASARAGDGPDLHLGGGIKHGIMLQKLSAAGEETVTAALREACRMPVAARIAGYGESVAKGLLDRREAVLGTIWHFYDRPLHLTRGSGAWLHAADGRAYLDAYNNVPQVGHSHPHVVRAIARQAEALNTNTRYLCDTVGAYAERLLAKLGEVAPGRFEICAFVNSGSEANDLAAQIARFATGAQGAIVMEDAYHGITATTVELSPLTAPAPVARVAHLPLPGHAEDSSADSAIATLAQRGYGTAFLMIDSALTSNGAPRVPAGWLETVARKVRGAGGLVIADEVQAGLGRLGQFWGFAAAGLESVDIVTLGKPVGNGHPLGVVITRRDLWQRFYAANEVFSTFGGNTVACAAGMAVLDVIEREDLIARGASTGDLFRDRLGDLATRRPLIGDVRGMGMMSAIAFNDPDGSPAIAATRAIVARMKDEGVLVGAAGRPRHALKLRPPLIWGEAEVGFFVAALDRVLQSLSQ